jgi:hypothetical protein
MNWRAQKPVSEVNLTQFSGRPAQKTKTGVMRHPAILNSLLIGNWHLAAWQRLQLQRAANCELRTFSLAHVFSPSLSLLTFPRLSPSLLALSLFSHSPSALPLLRCPQRI